MAYTCRLGLGVFFIVLALVLASLAFATDHWQVWKVNRQQLKAAALQLNGEDAKVLNTEALYFTRYSGLIRQCFPDNETETMLAKETVIDGNCIYVNYYLSESALYTGDNSDGFWLAMHVRRCLFGFMTAGLIMLLLSLVCGTYGCWTIHEGGIKATSVFLFLALVSIGGAIGTVIGLNYLERERVPELEISVLLMKYTTWSLSWSFYIACASCGVSLLAFIAESLVAFSMNREKQLSRIAAKKMRQYHENLTVHHNDSDIHFEAAEREPSPLQKAALKRNSGGEKMVPIIMYDNAGFDKTGEGYEKSILY